jgi:spermidine synthase
VPGRVARALCALFFISGAAALLFETLWFRLAGLTLGNSVWASSIVLASLMAGLALGNLAAARWWARVRRPVRTYGWLEVVCGVGGLALVLAFPVLARVAGPLLGALAEHPVLTNLCRLAIAFGVLLVPTTAMGATLPVLVRTLSRRTGFGPALGRLYGWNTLGAVAGALAGELALIPGLGLRGAGFVAAGLNLACGAAAIALSGRLPAESYEDDTRLVREVRATRVAPARAMLAAAAVCGAGLLGLEVLWFRLMQLFVSPQSAAFAVMLAVVLLGIGLGGLAGGRWLAFAPGAARWAPFIALACGLAVQATYVTFDRAVAVAGVGVTGNLGVTWTLSLWLMLPACALSGILFTLLGRALDPDSAHEASAAGALTVANTAGAAIGSLVTGFLLIPHLGVEGSLYALSLLYLAVAALTAPLLATAPAAGKRPAALLAAAGLVFALCAGLFPFGTMARDHLAQVARRYGSAGESVIALREGVLETILYMRRDLLGEPVSYQLVTNGFSMSLKGDVNCERYMRSYVYWPLAVHPQPRRALMISFGVGTTASALTDSPDFESITFVDISKDVLEVSRLGFPPPQRSPLDDPRVTVHVEDGRFFLAATRQRFDVITAEPPPPRNAGVVNLYTREYFALVRDRLDSGGIATYWLPVYQLDKGSTLAVIRGFCDVFEDCSLWSGSGLNWMLVGTRGLQGRVGEAHFRRLWEGGDGGRRLREVGFETPGHLGATFMADAPHIATLTAGVRPLTDDHPYRLRDDGPDADAFRFYFDLTDAAQARSRFEASAYVRSLWPELAFAETLGRFQERALYDRFFLGAYGRPRAAFADLRESLVATDSRWLPLVLVGSHPGEQDAVDRAVARGQAGPAVDYLLGVRALAHREYAQADALFARVQAREPAFGRILDFRALALCLGGDTAAAAAVLAGPRYRMHPEATERGFWERMRQTCAG